MIQAKRSTVVVVGTGMAGGRFVADLLERSPERFDVRMFGDEPHGTYNRILLSSVLGSTQDPSKLWLQPLEWYEKRGVGVHAGVRADHIDRKERVVHGGKGKVAEPYDVLVLATGSRPFVPPLPGANLPGVHVFRTLDDCARISAQAEECDRAVVLGGGLLGLEAARGLLSQGLDVTVIELGHHLMAQQLDTTGGSLLLRELEKLGLRCLLRTTASALLADEHSGRVRAVRLDDGTEIEADLVIVSCGIRANVEPAKSAGLTVERAIVVDDQLRTSDPAIFAVGECAQHRGQVYGLVDPVWEQARIAADIITGHKPDATYRGSRLATTLKVAGVDLTAMGEVHGDGPECEVVSHFDPSRGVYKKLVLRDNRLAGVILLGTPDIGGRLLTLFRGAEKLPSPAVDLLLDDSARDALLAEGGAADLTTLPDDLQICNCHTVPKNKIVAAIRSGKTTVDAIGEACKAGTGCGTCQPLLTQLITCYGDKKGKAVKDVNKIEKMKQERHGLDVLPDLLRLSETNNWQEMSEDDKQRAKWHGLFFRKLTPGHFMMRLRMLGGQITSRQLRVVCDLSDEYGKGFVDLTTRQQIQLRWFTLADVPDIWRRLEEVGLHSKQTGMDNVRGICGCPAAGVTPHELFDATPVIRELDDLILADRDLTNLPRKFNVTISACLENCCHPETQDIGLVPAYRELDGQQVNGFNVIVGGKQGSGGYTPGSTLDVFVRPEGAAVLCVEICRIFRDHGARAQRTRARLAFLIQDRGVTWFRHELQRRTETPLLRAGTDLRKKHHVDHLGISPQKVVNQHDALFSIGMLVPVGRITTAQLRAVADVAERYGTGDVRVTPAQNLVITNIPETRIGALTEEPIFKNLPYDPSPVMRGLVSCVGNDYCHFALIETKGWALDVARELERRTAGRKLQPLTIHWSGCSAGCGLHQVSTIGLQGCRSRVNGQVVDAAHVYVKGHTGPNPEIATDLMYDVPCDRLADALEPLVNFLPRR